MGCGGYYLFLFRIRMVVDKKMMRLKIIQNEEIIITHIILPSYAKLEGRFAGKGIYMYWSTGESISFYFKLQRIKPMQRRSKNC